MLSGEIARSESLSRVSLEAEVTFLHLVSVADDFGRFDGRPTVLLASLFPTRMESISLEVLGRWLGELEVEGLVRWYAVDGRRYVVLPTWSKYQRPPRAVRSKYPDPPEDASKSTAHDSESLSPLGSNEHGKAPKVSLVNPLTNDSDSLTNAPVFSGVVVGAVGVVGVGGGVVGVGEGVGVGGADAPAARAALDRNRTVAYAPSEPEQPRALDAPAPVSDLADGELADLQRRRAARWVLRREGGRTLDAAAVAEIQARLTPAEVEAALAEQAADQAARTLASREARTVEALRHEPAPGGRRRHA